MKEMMRFWTLCFFMVLFILGAHLVTAEEANKEILISGIRSQGDQFLFDPRPQESKFLKTYMGGFYISKQGARYYCLWDIIKKERDNPLYVRMNLQNPLDKDKPIIQEGVIQPEAGSLEVAYGPVEGLKWERFPRGLPRGATDSLSLNGGGLGWG